MKEIYIKYQHAINYNLIIIGLGLWQLIDWHFGSEDPIWHIFFYIVVIPIISFIYGIRIGDKKNCFIMPFIAYLVNLIVYIFMANGGFSFEIESLTLCLIPFLAMLIGVIIRKILLFIKDKMSK